PAAIGLTAGSQSSLREANKGWLVDTIKQFGGLTQVELADAPGLSAATVSTLVKQLTESRLVEVRPTSRSGRRAQLVTLARATGLPAGGTVGHARCRWRPGNSTGRSGARRRRP